MTTQYEVALNNTTKCVITIQLEAIPAPISTATTTPVVNTSRSKQTIKSNERLECRLAKIQAKVAQLEAKPKLGPVGTKRLAHWKSLLAALDSDSESSEESIDVKPVEGSCPEGVRKGEFYAAKGKGGRLAAVQRQIEKLSGHAELKPYETLRLESLRMEAALLTGESNVATESNVGLANEVKLCKGNRIALRVAKLEEKIASLEALDSLKPHQEAKLARFKRIRNQLVHLDVTIDLEDSSSL